MNINWLSYEGWQQYYEQIEENINQNKDYTIEINIDAENESQYITQLRFLFPLAVHLYQEKIVGNVKPLRARLNIISSICKNQKNAILPSDCEDFWLVLRTVWIS